MPGRRRSGRTGVTAGIGLVLVVTCVVACKEGPAKQLPEPQSASTTTSPPELVDGPQVTILSPVDAGMLQTSPQESPPHHTPLGGDWAADIAGSGGSYARFSNPSGALELTMEGASDPCGVPDSGGLGVTIGVTVDGVRVGTVWYLHLESVEVPPGPIANGSRLGEMITDPPVDSRCWGNVHTHIEARNERGRSCFLSRHVNSEVDAASAIGVLGGGLRNRNGAVCPTGHLDAATRVDGGVRVEGWARYAHAPGEAVRVKVLLDRRPVGEPVADRSRADVGQHGFTVTIPSDGRPHVVCATAIGVAGAPDAPLPNCLDV